jgi:sugar lactone lactonase YvrE
VDAAGNFYIADYDGGDNRIHKVTAATGIITTVAGNGTPRYSGDGGSATSAELMNPTAVAVDAAGNLYIADSGNNVIRKVTAATGIITTFAGDGTAGYSGDGSAATTAQLQLPRGLVIDTTGNLYIADYFNNSIRKVTASTGIITTVAGNGTPGYSGDGGPATSAELMNPTAVAVDGAGNLYIADEPNQVIRKVTAATGVITTIAGQGGTRGFSGDNGPAVDSILNDPFGVAVDSAGNLYIDDYDNQRIRKVSAYVPTDKDQCKKDGWMTLFRHDGSPFKNQGDCIQFVNTGK